MITPLEFLLLSGIVLSMFAGHMWLRTRATRPRSRVDERARDPDEPRRVLILTAAIGGGHEAIGRALAAELHAAGHEVVVADGLHILSSQLERLIREGYSRQIARAPWSWDIVFRLVALRPVARVVRALIGYCFARRLRPTIEAVRPDVVVSTYPLVTAALGFLRRRGRLKTPAVAAISDYGVHPLWVAPGVDLHVVASSVSAALTRHAGGAAALGQLPVSPAFQATTTRAEARAVLGIAPEAFTVLVVGGAWGVGDLEGAARCAVKAGADVIVVAGHNRQLLERLHLLFGSDRHVRIIGWATDMPLLMRAADCLIQNAGGMTCVEAIAIGLPILFYNPIPGHGRFNTRIMEQAGAVRWIHREVDLLRLLQAGVGGNLRLTPPKREVAAPLSAAILDLARTGVTAPVSASNWLRPSRTVARAALVAALVVALVPFSRHQALGAVGEVNEHVEQHPRFEHAVTHHPHIESYYRRLR